MVQLYLKYKKIFILYIDLLLYFLDLLVNNDKQIIPINMVILSKMYLKPFCFIMRLLIITFEVSSRGRIHEEDLRSSIEIFNLLIHLQEVVYQI